MVMTGNPPYFSTSLERGLKILDLFTEGRGPLGLSEISTQIGLNKTSTYRFVNTLVSLGYLKKDPETKQLRLGLKALVLAQDFLENVDVIKNVKPLIDDVFARYNVYIDLALREGDNLIILYRREVKDTLTFNMPTVSNQLYCTALGKAVLAFLPREESAEYLKNNPLKPRTDRTLIRKDSLLDELEQARKRGYSLNNQEYIPGLLAIGAPLISARSHKVVGAVSFDVSTVQYSIDQVRREFSQAIKDLASEISKFL
jgi:DNA-binding IclR family transcriptional regulator